MKYAIIVDSSCDMYIDDNYTNDTFMTRVPLKLRVGEKEYIDDYDLDIVSFMKEMSECSEATGTAAPSPQEWYNAFEKADEVFAVTITSALSGTYSSAVVAKNMILEDFPNKKIHIIDSKAAGSGLTMIVRKLQEFIKQQMDFEEIVANITEYCKKIKVFFILESMDNLVKSGRVSAIAGKLAGILGIKILGQASSEGTIELLRKTRGKDVIYRKTVDDMLANGYQGGKVIISHCFNEERVQFFLDIIKESFPDVEAEVMPTSGLCSYYAENKGLIISFEKE
ncbi:MAG: DegV family protein [Eubacterium sp.]|jgi:DegV family protein with EDD domain|nr:DegV family protein [Eubacterium sp.]